MYKPDKFIEHLLALYPCIQNDLMKSFKKFNREVNHNLTLDMYYCLQIVQWRGGMTMTAIAQTMNITRQQATLMVQKLFDMGLLERHSMKGDRRSIKVTTTRRAEEEIDQFHQNANGFMEQLNERFTNEELNIINDALFSMWSVIVKKEETSVE